MTSYYGSDLLANIYAELPIEDLLNSLAVAAAALEAIKDHQDVPAEIITFADRAHNRVFKVAFSLQKLSATPASAVLSPDVPLTPMLVQP